MEAALDAVPAEASTADASTADASTIGAGAGAVRGPVPTAARRGRRTRSPRAPIARLALGGCAALLTLPAPPAPGQTAGPAAPNAAIAVSVRAARERCFTETVEMAGHLMPREPVDVAPEREGLKVAQILAAPLDVVTAGQPLARLVPLGGADTPETTVTAPVSGLVLRSQGAVGQPVPPRQALFRLAARGEIEFVAHAPIPVLDRLRAGQPTVVRPLDGAGLPGRVSATEPAADPADQAGRVRIALEASPQGRVGTFARGTVTVDRRCGLGVPYSAVQYGEEGPVVQVLDGDRIETRQVAVGFQNGADVEVRSGLTASDLVVVRAGPFLREGDRVTPVIVR